MVLMGLEKQSDAVARAVQLLPFVRGGKVFRCTLSFVPFSLTRCHAFNFDFKVASLVPGRDIRAQTSVTLPYPYMLSCLSLADLVEHTLQGIFSKWEHLVIRDRTVNVNLHEGRTRLPVKRKRSWRVHHDATLLSVFVTGSRLECYGGWTTGSTILARHFSEIFSYHVTLKPSTETAVSGGRGSLEQCSDPDHGAARAPGAGEVVEQGTEHCSGPF